nr:hypothetical protein [Neobacillus sp. Marseille-Q6967]
MRLLNSKQGLRRSQFAKELKGADLEKVLVVPIDVSKVLQKSMILRHGLEGAQFCGKGTGYPNNLNILQM